jgi:ABC-type oligopeptide transport system substrate-binding subunit
MRTASFFGLSVVLIAAVLFLTACGGGSATSSTKSITSTSIKPVSSTTGSNTPSTPPSTSSAGSSTDAAVGKATALKFLAQPSGAKAG